MMDGSFALSLRTLLCPQCGGPVDVPVEGGAVTCSYCRFSHEVVRRPVRTKEASDSATPELPEPEWPRPMQKRLAGLHPAKKLPIVRAAWLECYRLLHEDYSRDLDRRLYVLTIGMQSVALQLNELRCVRAVLESALEATRDEGQRQVFRAELALDAAVAGEHEAARAWIDEIDAAFLGVAEIDTGVRLAQAVLALRERRPLDALGLLGNAPGEVPFARRAEIFARLLRVEAFEKLGLPGRAFDELDALYPFGRLLTRRVRRAYGLGEETVRRYAWGGLRAAVVVAAVCACIGGGVALALGQRPSTSLALTLAGFAAALALIMVIAWRARQTGSPPGAPIGYE
jgi:uncharacterized Zn finger protein (UPF0148 family)